MEALKQSNKVYKTMDFSFLNVAIFDVTLGAVSKINIKICLDISVSEIGNLCTNSVGKFTAV